MQLKNGAAVNEPQKDTSTPESDWDALKLALDLMWQANCELATVQIETIWGTGNKERLNATLGPINTMHKIAPAALNRICTDYEQQQKTIERMRDILLKCVNDGHYLETDSGKDDLEFLQCEKALAEQPKVEG